MSGRGWGRPLDKALASRPDRQTRGIVLSHKSLPLDRLGKRTEAIKTLGEFVLDSTSPLDVVELSRADDESLKVLGQDRT